MIQAIQTFSVLWRIQLVSRGSHQVDIRHFTTGGTVRDSCADNVVLLLENSPKEDHTKLIYGISLLVVQFVIPALIMSFCYWKILQKVRTDWIVEEGSMLTAAQQAQTAVRKRRVMYVLILMVVVFMTSWLPLSAVNLIKDLEIPLVCKSFFTISRCLIRKNGIRRSVLWFWFSQLKFMCEFRPLPVVSVFLTVKFLFHILEQMYFKLLNVHAIAMTSVVWNPLLYFWMSKRHRRALKDDMTWLTNVRRHTNVGVLSRFAPSPSVSLIYRRTLERHLGVTNFRRGTLADPTCTLRERAQADLHSNCFLLVPLMPLCQSVSRRSSHLTIDDTRIGISRHPSRRPSCGSATLTKDR
ncbi:7 transmembrane receptor [Trichostrongylus colubriformis]|uniref:7 transmembrane receptor n=1 Tax=Trichostrongylus colubriformis TaxID=6319 RepID=A0AAN8IIC4_TRICO